MFTAREHVFIAFQSGLAFTANRCCGSHLGRATCSEGRSVFASTAGSRRLIVRIQTGLISRIDSAFVRLARYSAASRPSAVFSRAHLDRCPLFPFDFNAGTPDHLYLPSLVQRVSSPSSFFFLLRFCADVKGISRWYGYGWIDIREAGKGELGGWETYIRIYGSFRRFPGAFSVEFYDKVWAKFLCQRFLARVALYSIISK